MNIFFVKLFSILTKHDKRFLSILIFASVLISLVEMIGISAILPFISIASDFSYIHSNIYLHKIYIFFDFKKEIDFVIASGIILLLFYFLRSSLNLCYFYLLSRFSKGRYSLIAYRLFENYLGMSYRTFVDKNSSELSKTIINEASNLTVLLYGLLVMFSEIFVVIFIYSVMLYINWKITLLISIVLIVNALFLATVVSPIIKKAGVSRESYENNFFKIIQTNLSNFKMMKLSSDIQPVLQSFDIASSGYARANTRNDTLSQVPRLFLEALGFGIVISMVLYLINKNQTDISSVLPIITMFVLGLYRLMPSANRILSGYNQVLFYKSSLDIIHNDLMYAPENLKNDPIEYNNVIQLNDIGFEYDESKPILKNITFEIHKGDQIAFIGKSGSGKSTLLDLIMGLYSPQYGEIKVDDTRLDEHNIKSWRKKIGYIPQNIYLFDGTVAQNVAFNKPINEKKLVSVLKQANIMDFLDSHHEGIYTKVGDGGIKLSGGQRQRIAIARALYNDPEILVLDEATSALDTHTEAKIMEEIYNLVDNRTLIIITHRLSTIQKCKNVYEMVDGRLTLIPNS